MKKRNLFLLPAMLLALGACSSGGGHKKDPYYHAWYDVYGYYCGTGYPTSGCNFYSDGTKIIDYEDPYFNNSYNLQYAFWTYYDSYGFPASYLGYAWLSPTNILYDQYGYALNETGEETGNDIIEAAAKQLESKIQIAGKGFAEKYALQEATGVDVARTLSDWATLTKDRKVRVRTEKDMADFSKRLFGIDAEAAKAALGTAVQGDLNQVKQLNRQIAEKWGTNPETSEQILRSWYRDFL